jgi:heat shock protein HtpX
MNGIKTALLLGLLSSVLLFLGQTYGGQSGLVMAFGMAVIMNFVSYFFSEKMALSMSGAQRVSETEHADVYHRVYPMTKRLTEKMNIPMPKLWVLPEEQPNAFATGRNPANSSVALSAGLLHYMNDDEVEAVIGHELGHILNRDILISSVAATFAAAITSVARFAMFFGGGGGRDEDDRPNPLVGMLMMLLAPIAAMLIQMAISRTREYGADAAAARYMGSTAPMISALSKLEGYKQRIPMNASPATAHMYIISPGNLMKLFSTHPATQERIAALRQLQLT